MKSPWEMFTCVCVCFHVHVMLYLMPTISSTLSHSSLAINPQASIWRRVAQTGLKRSNAHKFEINGTIEDLKKKYSGRKKTVQVPANISTVKRQLQINPQASIQQIAA